MPTRTQILSLLRTGSDFREVGEGAIDGGSQALVNPPTNVPTRNERIERWMRARTLDSRGPTWGG